MKQNIIISPSGQLYGSENVLFDFIEGSTIKYKIYVPHDSVFFRKLNVAGVNVEGFKNLLWLYFIIFIQILVFKKSLLLNEAGHINYIKILAKFFPNRKFVVIIRLLEDCNIRLKDLPSNISLIAVSEFIKSRIQSNLDVTVIYDPFRLTNSQHSSTYLKKADIISVGIIGRISSSKGLSHFLELVSILKEEEIRSFHFNFYGTFNKTDRFHIDFENKLKSIVNLNYEFKGFETNQNKIYSNCNIILHFNKIEALGRILFETVNFKMPFLCFNQGGAGELSKKLGMDFLAVNDIHEMKLKLLDYFNGRLAISYEHAIQEINQNFNPESYAKELEKFL
jgi:glycosyltransferase involved in cell wall biosynthesis